MSSLDGRLGLPGVLLLQNDERWSAIGGNEFTDMWSLHEPQVQLEGSNSFVSREAPGADVPPAPAGVDVHSDFLPHDIVTAGRRFFAVVDSRGRVRWTRKIGEHEEHLVILVSEVTPPAYLAFLRKEAIPYLVAGTDRVDLRSTNLHGVTGRLIVTNKPALLFRMAVDSPCRASICWGNSNRNVRYR